MGLTTMKPETNTDNKMDTSSYSLVTQEGQVDNGRSREEELIHMALSNHLIRDQIVMNVDVKEILKCRLINSNWDDTVTSLVSRSKVNLPAISFKFALLQDDSFGYKSTEGHGDLMDFTKLFISSSNFPYNNFSFQDGPLMTSDMIEFLAHFGHCVKILSLEMSFSIYTMNLPYTTVGNLRECVITGVPNVESLTLNGTPRIWEEMTFKLFPTGQKLPRLKTLEFGQCYVNSRVMRDLLVAAVNLEMTKGITSHCLKKIFKANKKETMTTFFFEPCNGELSLCHQLTLSKPQLQEIGLYFAPIFEYKRIWPQVGHILTKLLESSQLSLQRITVFHPVSFLGQSMKIPQLVNVKEITFSEFHDSYESPTMTDHQMFPSGQRLSDLFPNLVKIHFFLDPPTTGRNDLVWESIFRGSESLPSVKMLEFDACANKTVMDKFPTLFPNVDHLIIKLRTLTHFPSLFGPFWTISPDVKTMEIFVSCNLDYEYNENLCVKMDSVMTGISVRKCHQFANKLARLQSKGIENLRTNPSIVSLTKLKYFSMEFNLRGSAWADPTKPIFSHVTGIHAFQFMKDRQNLVVSLNPRPSPTALSM